MTPDQGPARAATGTFPYPHRTVAEVLGMEAQPEVVVYRSFDPVGAGVAARRKARAA